MGRAFGAHLRIVGNPVELLLHAFFGFGGMRSWRVSATDPKTLSRSRSVTSARRASRALPRQAGAPQDARAQAHSGLPAIAISMQYCIESIEAEEMTASKAQTGDVFPGGAGHGVDATLGRPRQADLDERIKQAAVHVLREEGFAGLSVNRVCQRAGIPRPTFYRRWPSGEAALFAAFNDRFDDALLADRGDARADLLDFGIRVRNRYDDVVVSACLPAIYEARRRQPELIEPIMTAQQARRKANVATLTDAFEQQALSPLLSPFEILFLIAAAIDQAYLADRPATDDFLERLIVSILR